MKNFKSIFILLFLFAYSLPIQAQQQTWYSVRDGLFNILPSTENESLTIDWQHAWQSQANDEELYLINSNGELVDKVLVSSDSSSGSYSTTINSGNGPYKLIIPGYSFRNYQLSHGSQTSVLYEPNKVHFSTDIPKEGKLYFTIPNNSNVQFSGKYHSGASLIKLKRLRDNLNFNLYLDDKKDYSHFNTINLPSSESDEIWVAIFNKSGKVSFWLDGTENLFSINKDNIKKINFPKATTNITLTNQHVGLTPDLGTAVPYFTPVDSTHDIITSLNIKSANFYSFFDALKRVPDREIEFRKLYQDKFNIKNNITILAGTGRRAVLTANAETFYGLSKWADDTLLLDSGANHYIAFADEPNLNYRSYAQFSSYFKRMLDHLKSRPGYANSGIKVAVPASSRFLDGPFRPAAETRKGIDWAERLLNSYGDDIQAIAWHEWMTRSLYATRRYQNSIQAAAKLVGINEHGRPNKSLLIDQTNISSGYSLSPYDQETYFAALWWASVVINSSQEGLLEMLNWFHIADEIDYRKGFIAQPKKNNFKLKPVAHAQIFITEQWLKNVKKLHNSSFEVDVLHTQDDNLNQLLGVNKSNRPHQVTVKLATDCPSSLAIEILDKNSNTYLNNHNCSNKTIGFSLPEHSIFKISWNL